jgi:hypothetical protein
VSTLRSAAAPPSSSLLSLISWAPSLDPFATSCLGAAGRGAGRSGGLGFLRKDEGGARLYLGILVALGKLQIGSTVFTWSYRGVK